MPSDTYTYQVFQRFRTSLNSGHVHRQLLTGSGGILALRGASLALGFISTILLSRNLGASGYGVYAWAIAWTGVLQLVASLGLDTLMVRELAANHVTRAWSTMRGLLRVGRKVVLLSSVGLTALGVVAGLTLVAPEQRATFLVALATVPALTIMTVQEGALRGLGKVVTSRTAEDLVRPIGLIVLLAAGWGIFTLKQTAPIAMALQAVATVVASLVCWGLLRRAIPKQIHKVEPVATVGRLVGQAVPLILLRALNTILSQIDIILVGILRDPTQVALYATATRMAGFVGIAEYAVNAAFLPVASRLFASHDMETLDRTTPRVALGGALLSTLFAAPLIVFAPQITNIFGESFAGAASSLRILCVAFVISAIFGQNLGLLTMTRNVRLALVGSGVALISNIGLNLLFIPMSGAHGAAIAWFLSVIIWNSVLAVLVHRSLGIRSTPLALIPGALRRVRHRHIP
jgi:O-antigen/teichoic acid export membrane protein